MSRLPLIAVIGPVEPHLFKEFIEHYRRVGVSDIFVAFHFIPEVPQHKRSAVLDVCNELVGPPALISQGPWHEDLHASLRDHLRSRAGTGWQILADIDEFHSYTDSPSDLIAAAEAVGSHQIGGILLDRVADDGKLCGWEPSKGLDATYSLGGFLTSRLLGGHPRKIVVAHSSVDLVLGSHRSVSGEPVNEPLVPVHHFKWRAGVLDDLKRRVEEHTRGSWREFTPAIRTEAAELLRHVEKNEGRIDVEDPSFMFQSVSLYEIPDNWSTMSRQVFIDYQQFRKW